MKRLVKIFIEGIELDLFNDETIQVTSSVQNISDISKVFTDFSQSFTVPATTHNNQIFQHFYQSDVNSTIDQNLRRDAFIEIDLTSFRRGKIQLEKANIKNNQVDSYTITFYGDILSLKDKFGEDKLFDLDYSTIAFEFNPTEVYNRITDLTTDYDVRYPLITSERFWQYHVGSEDITSTAHAIRSDELFPAVKISKIFDFISVKYQVRFEGAFLQTKLFTDCFLWFKNTNTFSYLTEAFQGTFNSIITTVSPDPNIDPSLFVNIPNSSILLLYNTNNVLFHTISFSAQSLSATANYFIEVYQNGNLYTVLDGNNTNTLSQVVISNTSGLNSLITFKVKANTTVDIDFNVTYSITKNDYQVAYTEILCNTIYIAGNVNFNNLVPDIKVQDFFAGILKQFNMTCVGIEPDTYEILPLDEWYSKGAIVDITQYTNTDSIDIERLKLYKKISFKYQDSESFVNQNYFKTYSQKYGNLEYKFNYDGDEYTIETPFENLLFTRAVDNGGSEAILGYCLNTSYNSYIPKPCLFYLYGESDVLDHNIKFKNTTGHLNISTYALFGQDLTYNNTKYSLNFGVENSIIHLEAIQNGLYATYYFPYLNNLFNLKNRLVYVKTILPVSLLTNLKLNDRLIIRDKRYIINDMKSNLTNGEVDFSLYLDFRPVLGNVVDEKTNEAQCINYNINLPNGAYRGDLSSDLDSVTFSQGTITQDTNVEICIPANETGEQRTIIITIVFTFNDGTQITTYIYIIQEP
jgi:hypothetical protein